MWNKSNDLAVLFKRTDAVDRWNAESENASARLEMARMRRNIAHLLSQHEPVAQLGIDRERLRVLLSFVEHGDHHRLRKDVEAACEQ